LQAEPALVEVEEPGHAWRALPVTLVDLAAGGLGLLAEEPISPGSRVRVTFPLPDELDDLEDGDTALVDLAPWKGQGEVVHTHTGRRSEPGQSHIPLEARRPHHHGVRFHNLEDHAETRLLRALYGRLPDGWAVERYAQRGPRGEGEVARYAVVRGGKRVAQGFSTYDRARTRAMSLHMDEQAVAARRRREAQSERQS
jgi:hypothetical protein